jgi:hypothetical protein
VLDVRLGLRLLWIIPIVLTGVGCSDDGDLCPAEFKPGDLCEIVGLECIPPGSECDDTTCLCSDEQAGGFFWDCTKVPYCRCTCPCGKIAINTCEALGCTKRASEPCPAKSAAVCEVVCAEPDAGPDIGPPDAKPDLPPPDLGPDMALDQGLDIPLDQTPDLPLPDQSVLEAAIGDTSPSPDTSQIQD